MMRRPRTLAAKLILVLLGLFAVAGAAHVALTVTTTRLHLEVATQTLNRMLAADIVRQQWLMRGEVINQAALKSIFSRLMAINPSIEVYLLDRQGGLLSFSAPPGSVKRQSVALGPIADFLAGKRELPIRGDDPRDVEGRKVFSAAEVHDSGAPAGYLYIILGGQEFDTVFDLFRQNYVLRLSAAVTVLALALTALLGGFVFYRMTRRLRGLAGDMDGFWRAGYATAPRPADWRRGADGDEIDRLGVAFSEMSGQIARQIEDLKRADAERRDMVAAISHDLRTPLTSLQGYLETLVLKADTLDEAEKQAYLDTARRHGERLSRLVADLFELATLEAPEARIRAEPFPINELASDVAQKFALKAEEKQISLVADLPQSMAFVDGDIALIERVLENLIENAIRHTPSGGQVRLAIAAASETVTTEVSDTGPGIAEADLPHLFDRFYQAGGDGSRSTGGAGLGLAIAQRVIALHGGTIQAGNTDGGGARFRFPLPVASP